MTVLKNLLVATDFGEAAALALSYGRDLARACDATLHVVHVVESFSAQVVGVPVHVPSLRRLDDELEAAARMHLQTLVADEGGRAIRTKLEVLSSPWPARAILDYARDADIDLLIIGTHGRGRVAELLIGGVAAKIVRQASCPVLTVRHPRQSSTSAIGNQPRHTACVNSP